MPKEQADSEQANKEVADMEMEAYRSIPTTDRQARFWAMIFAAVAAGVGSGSPWIGISVFLSLFYLGSCVEIALLKHRYLTKT